MNEKKNIDRLFQEKFKDFEVAPNDAMWDRISESLPNKKKKRRVIPIWWQIGGVAATIALLLTLGFLIFDTDSDSTNTENPKIVDTEQINPSNTTTTDNSTNEKQEDLHNVEDLENMEVVNSDDVNENNDKSTLNSNFKNDKNSDDLTETPISNSNSVAENNKNEHKTETPKNLVNDTQDKRSTVASTEEKQKLNDNAVKNETELKSAIKHEIENNTTAVAENTNTKASDDNSTTSTLEKEEEALTKEDTTKPSILEAIANNAENIDEKEKEDEQQNRWSIKPNVAPVYFSSLGQGSTIHNQFTDNSKNSEVSMSYGISGSYAISDKLRIRAGINRVDLNYATSDVIAFTGVNALTRNGLSQGNINFRDGAIVSMVSLETLNNASSPEAFTTKTRGDIDQRFGFVEVPLELEYRVIDKKFGLNVIGGFSTLFLNQNEIYVDIDGTSTLIGEANNINSTSFSANFGLGLDYNLSKRWNINLEPQFKYQINTFNNTFGNFRPFFIGVYTGLSFKF